MEDEWLTYAKRLQAVATAGLAYSENPYDLERFREVSAIAQQMLARLFSLPIERLVELAPDAKAYPTPSIDVRGAVIEGGRILLVKEGATGRWTLPGGFAEIGLSAAENVVKEIREEAGLVVAARHLYGVRHKAKGPFRPDARDFYKLYFLCEKIGTDSPQHGPEVLDVGYFSPDALPELCTDRIVAEDIQRAFACHRAPGGQPFFD